MDIDTIKEIISDVQTKNFYDSYEKKQAIISLFAWKLNNLLQHDFDYYVVSYLLVSNLDPIHAIKFIQTPNDILSSINILIFRLIYSERKLGNSLDSYPVGLSILRSLTSLQDDLNVKRFDEKEKNNNTNQFMLTPSCEIIIREHFQDYTWFRLLTSNSIECTKNYPNAKYNIIDDNYCEIYFYKPTNKNMEELVINIYNDPLIIKVVFCSNLRFIKKYFSKFPHIIFSNIFSYICCYNLQTKDILVTSQNSIKIFCYQLLSLIFMTTNNLNTIKTKSPLLQLSIERSVSAISKYKNNNAFYPIESQRCNNIINLYTNVGSTSNNDMIIKIESSTANQLFEKRKLRDDHELKLSTFNKKFKIDMDQQS